MEAGQEGPFARDCVTRERSYKDNCQCNCYAMLSFFKKWANPGLFSFIFGLFKQTLIFLQQIDVKKVHPVYGAGIRTHDHWNMSLFP